MAPDQFIAAAERKRLPMCSIKLSGQRPGDDKFLPYVIEQFHRSPIDGSFVKGVLHAKSTARSCARSTRSAT